MDRASWVTRFGADPDSWNCGASSANEDLDDKSGFPGSGIVGAAVATFVAAAQSRNRPADAETVAAAFNLPIPLIEYVIGRYDPADLDEAIQTWSGCRCGNNTIGEAADAFSVDVETAHQAVASHYWMFVTEREGGLAAHLIEHDGE